MRGFAGTLGKAPGHVAAIIAVTTFIAATLAGVLVSSQVDRVARLESDLGRAQAKIAELTASASQLGARIDAADRTIRSLKTDFDHPQVRPLAAIPDAGARLRQ
jgi:hypothetical protein